MSSPAKKADRPIEPMGSKAIGLYVGLALALSWAIQIPAILHFGLDSSITKGLFVLVMWSPTLLALIFMVKSRAARQGVRWRLGKLRYWPVGIGVETVVGFGVLGVLMLAGVATSGWFTFSASGVSVSGGPWVFGTGDQAWALYLLNVGATALAYSSFSLIATVGEEFAWRGFLQGHLERACGFVPAVLLIALIWWAWHLPGLVAGYNFPETPYLGAFVLFPLQMIGASLFFGWLTVRSGTFWPAALAHGAVNSIQQGVIDNLSVQGPALYADLTRTALILAVGLICLVGVQRTAGRRRDAPHA